MDDALRDELLVVESIYPDLVRIFSNDDFGDLKLVLRLPELFQVEVSFPAAYPSMDPPLYSLDFTASPDLSQELTLKNQIIRDIAEGFSGLFTPGEGVLCAWIEMLVEKIPEWQASLDSVQVSSCSVLSEMNEVDHGAEQVEIPIGCPVIHHSPTPLINKKSVFVAHAAQVQNAHEIALVKQVLLSDKKIARATHNITAFRWEDETGLIRQECDDDGETAAGGRLLHMLQSADCRGVFVMVTRWCVLTLYEIDINVLITIHRYGGIQLGPQRFKDINNCARDLLESVNLIPDKSKKRTGGK